MILFRKGPDAVQRTSNDYVERYLPARLITAVNLGTGEERETKLAKNFSTVRNRLFARART